MENFYKPPFRKFIKKQTTPFQLVIEDEIEKVIMNPEIGESKKGDLKGFRIHKFSFKKNRFLIAYRFQESYIVFYIIGAHETFYRELKRYLREVG